jgi:putative ABC transport system permease protein
MMFGNIFKFGWRNLLRNKRRTYLTLTAVAIGVMSIIFAKSYFRGIFNGVTNTVIKTQIGHIRIVHKEFLRLERIMPKEYLVTDLNRVEADISRIPDVELMNEQIRFNVMLNHEDANEPAVAFGVDPAKVDKTMDLSSTIVKGKYFDASGSGLIIGKKLAEKLKVTVNDELLLVTTDINYSTYALPFNIVGIFETGFSSLDKHILYIPIQKAQEMLDCGDAAHEILVFLKEREKSGIVCEKIEKILSESDPKHEIQVIPWQKNDMIESIPTMMAIFDVIIGIIMFIVALVILNTMLMAVMERYHEIGVIKALGFKNSEVFLMILVEALYIGAIGSLIGGIFGGVLSAYLEKTGIDVMQLTGGFIEKIDIPIPYLDKVIYFDLTLSILVGSLIFGIFVALVAVLYPAIKSSRMQPVEAFRSELKV